jgi:head-tail adaptor
VAATRRTEGTLQSFEDVYANSRATVRSRTSSARGLQRLNETTTFSGVLCVEDAEKELTADGSGPQRGE